MAVIKLQSSDGELFTADVEIAKLNVTVKMMLEDLGIERGTRSNPLPRRV